MYVPEQQGQTAVIRVSLDPDVVQRAIDLLRPPVVLHVPEVAVALLVVPVEAEEVVLGQLEHEREQHEQLAHNLEMDVPRERLDLVPVLAHHSRVSARVRVLGREFGDVVDLRVVLDPRARLQFAEPLRLVPVVPAVFEVGAVLQFFFLWQVE